MSSLSISQHVKVISWSKKKESKTMRVHEELPEDSHRIWKGFEGSGGEEEPLFGGVIFLPWGPGRS